MRAAHQGRLRLAQGTGETKKIHDVLAEMLTIWPNDPAVQNDEGYTRLLLIPQRSEVRNQRSEDQPTPTDSPKNESAAADNQEVENIERLAADLVQREPTSLPHRTLLALARLRLGKFSEALSAYDQIQVSRGALTASALAVHAAVLAANGRNEDAAAEIRDLDRKRLLPEEGELLDKVGN
jgi:hypothetical protein